MTYAQVDWYHIAHTSSGVHVHRLEGEKLAGLARELMAAGHYEDADQAIADAVGKYAQAIRALLEFPEDYMNLGGWTSIVSPGEPHPDLMAIATLHDDLPEVTATGR